MIKKELPNRNDSGFRIPDNYFGEFETRMLNRVSSREDHIGGPLKSSPFKVSEDYFENLESRLFERIETEASKTRVIPIFTKKNFSFMAGIAAVLAIILYSVVLDQEQSFSYKDLDMIAVENYLLESIEYSSPEEMQLIQEGDFSFAISAQSDLNQEAVLEYLQENLEDPSLLLNEQ